MNLSYPLARAATYYGAQPAVQDLAQGVSLSYAELDQRVNRLANALLAAGVRPGDRVAQLQSNSFQFIEVMFATARIGAARVPITTRLSDADKQYILADSGAHVLIVDEPDSELAAQCLRDVDSLETVISTVPAAAPFRCYDDVVADGRATPPDVRVDTGGLARLNYTGGTTGQPKGVMTNHHQLLAVAVNILLDNADLTERDSLLHVQPLTTGGGTYVVPAVLRGARQVIVPRFDADEVLRTCIEQDISFVKVVPTMFVRMLSSPYFEEAMRYIRLLGYGASPMPTDQLIEGINRVGARFTQTYGQSEAPATICTLNRFDIENAARAHPERLASVGRPYSTNEVRLVDDDGRDCTGDQVGEIAVRGPIVMMGYWNNPAATAEKIHDGWVFTGDLGRVDDAGYVYLVDRKNDLIISGGYNVYPGEVEQALYSHPSVKEAAVVGIPDTEWGERVSAVVTLRPGAHAGTEEILRHVEGQVTRYKRPRSLAIWEQIPVTAAGKISRRDVRKILLEQPGEPAPS